MSTADAGKGQELTAAPINLQQSSQNKNKNNNQNQHQHQNSNRNSNKNRDANADYSRIMKLKSDDKANRNNPNNPLYKNRNATHSNQNKKNKNQNQNQNPHKNQNHNKNQSQNQNQNQNQNHNKNRNKNQNKNQYQNQNHQNRNQNRNQSKQQKHPNQNQNKQQNKANNQNWTQNRPNSHGKNNIDLLTPGALSLQSRIGVKREHPDEDEALSQPFSYKIRSNASSYGVHEGEVFDYIAQVGQGTYGKVFKVKNTLTGKLLAMKRLRVDNENEGFPVTAAREIKLLQSIHHTNIVHIEEMVVAKGEIYMGLDYVEHDLAGILLNNELVIEPGHAKSLAKQMFRALGFLHKKKILHRDIKGSNMLITADGVVKLADFGLARKLDLVEPNQRLTNRVITMWYRPPELLLGTEFYGGEVDIWGLGCLLVEIFTKQPLFHGTDEVSQLQAIYNIMGAPSAESWPEHLELPWIYLMKSMGPQNGMGNARYQFDRIFAGPNISSNCFDLASKLLQLNPSKRLTATEALDHPYFVEEPPERFLDLRTAQEWHDWEAKRRKKNEH